MAGKIVIDTTNQFGSGPMPAPGQTAAAFNAARMPGARYTKSFNTPTAAFQAGAASRPTEQRVVQWLCGDDVAAKQRVGALIEDAGYAPVDLGGTAGCAVMEAPRRAGAVYGEEWRLPEALAVVEAVRARAADSRHAELRRRVTVTRSGHRRVGRTPVKHPAGVLPPEPGHHPCRAARSAWRGQRRSPWTWRPRSRSVFGACGRR